MDTLALVSTLDLAVAQGHSHFGCKGTAWSGESARNWVSEQHRLVCLVCLGLLPAGWALVCDLQPRWKGRVMQKAHELICWWLVSNRITHRHSLAATIYAATIYAATIYADEADEPSAAELHFLCSEEFMLAAKRSEPGECTHAVPGAAPDEVVSGWSVNLRLCMPGPVCTRNERLIVADPLSASELRQQRSCRGFLWGKAPLAEEERACCRRLRE